MKTRILSNGEMYQNIPHTVRSAFYHINGQNYRFLEAVRIGKSLGLTEIRTTEGNTLLVNNAVEFLKNLAAKRITYYSEVHDRSRTEWIQCYNCGNWHEPDEMSDDWQGNFICEDCADREFCTCDACGNLVHEDDITCTEDTSNSYSQTFCPDRKSVV